MKLSTPATVPQRSALGTPITASRAHVATPKTMLMHVLIRRYRDICCSVSNIARLMRVRCVPLGKRYAISRRNMDPDASRKNVRKTIVSTPLMACAVVQPTLASGPPPGVGLDLPPKQGARREQEEREEDNRQYAADGVRGRPTHLGQWSPARRRDLDARGPGIGAVFTGQVGDAARRRLQLVDRLDRPQLRLDAPHRRRRAAQPLGSGRREHEDRADDERDGPECDQARRDGLRHAVAAHSSHQWAKQQRQQDGDGDGHEQAARELQRRDEQHSKDPRHERDEEPRSKGDRTRWSSGPLGVDQLLYDDGKVSHVQPVNRVYQRWSALAPNPIAGTVPDRETPFGRPVLAGRRRVA